MSHQFWRGLLGLATVVLMLLWARVAHADSGQIASLNVIGAPTTVSQHVQAANSSTLTSSQTPVTNASSSGPSQATNQGQVVGNLFAGIGVTNQSSQRAHTMLKALTAVVNVIFSIILGGAALGMFLITALDLLYIGVPPIRNWLQPPVPVGNPFQNAVMQAQMQQGNGYYGYRYGGNDNVTPMIHPAINLPFLTQWISDEAKVAVRNGMWGQAQNGSFKSILVDYSKKRAFFHIMFGVVVVLLSTMVCTNLGMKVAQLVLSKLNLLRAS